MRAVYLLAALGFAIWAVPTVELPQNGMPENGVIRMSVLSDMAHTAPLGDAPASPPNVGGDTLVFAVPPKPQAGPILPDYPWPLHETAPDTAPVAMGAPAFLRLSGVEPVTARLPSTRVNRNYRRVTANSLNMRSGPAKRFSAVTALHAGTVAEVTGRSQSGWVPIKLLKTGQRGWVFHRFLAPMRG